MSSPIFDPELSPPKVEAENQSLSDNEPLNMSLSSPSSDGATKPKSTPATPQQNGRSGFSIDSLLQLKLNGQLTKPPKLTRKDPDIPKEPKLEPEVTPPGELPPKKSPENSNISAKPPKLSSNAPPALGTAPTPSSLFMNQAALSAYSNIFQSAAFFPTAHWMARLAAMASYQNSATAALRGTSNPMLAAGFPTTGLPTTVTSGFGPSALNLSGANDTNDINSSNRPKPTNCSASVTTATTRNTTNPTQSKSATAVTARMPQTTQQRTTIAPRAAAKPLHLSGRVRGLGKSSGTAKKYKCDVCHKSFSRSNTLITHKRIHTGEKPFKCEHCGRAFRQPGNLTRHRLTHTTVKPYICAQCGKAFNRASNLHTHMRTHTSFRPFMCNLCGKGFHQRADLKIHMYTHTGESRTHMTPLFPSML